MRILRLFWLSLQSFGSGRKIFIVGCMLAVIAWFWPYPFSQEMMLYNSTMMVTENEESIDNLKVLVELAHRARDRNVREASAYNLGTLLAQDKDYAPPKLSEEVLKEAVHLNPHDEDAKLNLEIVLNRRYPNRANNKDSSSESKQPGQKTQGSGDGSEYGRGESSEDY